MVKYLKQSQKFRRIALLFAIFFVLLLSTTGNTGTLAVSFGNENTKTRLHLRTVRNMLELESSVIKNPIDKLNTEKISEQAGKEDGGDPVIEKPMNVRTATGGIIHRIMVFLTIVSFIGNGIFMINVFWYSK